MLEVEVITIGVVIISCQRLKSSPLVFTLPSIIAITIVMMHKIEMKRYHDALSGSGGSGVAQQETWGMSVFSYPTSLSICFPYNVIVKEPGQLQQEKLKSFL